MSPTLIREARKKRHFALARLARHERAPPWPLGGGDRRAILDVAAGKPPRTRHAAARIFAVVPLDAACEQQAAKRARGSLEAPRKDFCAAPERPWHPSNYLSGQRMAYKSTPEGATGFRDRPRDTFCHCRCCACCHYDMLTIPFCACGAQVFDLQQRAVRLQCFTDGLLHVLLWS